MTAYEKSQYRKGYENGKTEALSEYLEKTLNIALPFALIAEEYVLGALIAEIPPQVKDKYFIFDFLQPDDFCIKEQGYGVSESDFTGHKALYDLLQKMHFSNLNMDFVTVVTEAQKQGVYEAVGGASYISNLANKVGSSANIVFHGKVIKQKSYERAALFFYQKKIMEIQSGKVDIFDHIDSSVLELSEIVNISNVQDKRTEQIAAVTIVKNTLEGKYPLLKLTGLEDIDKILGLNEVQAGLIFVTGETGSGKSAFQNTIALQCHKENIKLWANSAETSTYMQVMKLLAASPEIELIVKNDPNFWEGDECTANFERILRGQRYDGTPFFTQTQINDIIAAAQDIAENSSVITTSKTGYTVEKYIAECLREVKNGVKVFCYDRHELFAGSKQWDDADKSLSLLRQFCLDYGVVVFDFIQMSKPAGHHQLTAFKERLRGGVSTAQAAMTIIGIERYGENDEVCFHIQKNSYGRVGEFGVPERDVKENDQPQMRFKFLPMKQIFVQSRISKKDIEYQQIAPEIYPFQTPTSQPTLADIRISNTQEATPSGNNMPF